jgi:hypothetical protein
MKKTALFLFAFLVLLIAATVLASSVDDQGTSNDPRVNERANACYEGGTLAFRCTSDDLWELGWYLIRFEFGLISRENFPARFAYALPPLWMPFTPVATLVPTVTLTPLPTTTPLPL